MPLVDLDKTSYKFKDVMWFFGIALAAAGGVWRFESKMSDFESKLDALETKILYKTTLEFMKVNSRIDLIEAKKYVMRYNFKRRRESPINNISLAYNEARTDNGKSKQERRPQVCVILPRPVELRRLKLPNVKKLKQLA